MSTQFIFLVTHKWAESCSETVTRSTSGFCLVIVWKFYDPEVKLMFTDISHMVSLQHSSPIWQLLDFNFVPQHFITFKNYILDLVKTDLIHKVDKIPVMWRSSISGRLNIFTVHDKTWHLQQFIAISVFSMYHQHFHFSTSSHTYHAAQQKLQNIWWLKPGPLTWEIPDSNSSGFSPLGFTILALVLNMAFVSAKRNKDIWVTYYKGSLAHLTDMDPGGASNQHVPR